MKYMLLIYPPADGDAANPLSDDEQRALTAEYMAIRNEPNVVGGAHLQPGTAATTVRVDDGRALTTDGPFVETKEELGGYFEVDAANLDEALDVAARIPAARTGGAVEIRPVVQES